MISVMLFDPNDPSDRTGPTWWRKFAESVPGKGSARLETLNTELMNYAAQFHCTGKGGKHTWGNRYIDFYDERAYNWFVLRWA